MVNRVQYLRGDPPEAMSYTDFYEVEAAGDTYIVALSTALAIGAQHNERAAPDWLEFHDVFGARHRLPGRYRYRISESRRVTRAHLRELKKMVRKGTTHDLD